MIDSQIIFQWLNLKTKAHQFCLGIKKEKRAMKALGN